MAAEPSTKAKAWAIYDRIVAEAAPGGEHSNPWSKNENGDLVYEADYDTLTRLLGVPLYLKAPTTTGCPRSRSMSGFPMNFVEQDLIPMLLGRGQQHRGSFLGRL